MEVQRFAEVSLDAHGIQKREGQVAFLGIPQPAGINRADSALPGNEKCRMPARRQGIVVAESRHESAPVILRAAGDGRPNRGVHQFQIPQNRAIRGNALRHAGRGHHHPVGNRVLPEILGDSGEGPAGSPAENTHAHFIGRLGAAPISGERFGRAGGRAKSGQETDACKANGNEG